MNQPAAQQAVSPILAVSRAEFIALCASLMALNALAIDVILPGLSQMGAALGVENENARQYVITAYAVSFGAAQLFFGPICDRFGRRAPLLVGLSIYIAAAAFAVVAPSFEVLLFLRALQGAGAAATRVVAISSIRDVYGGRRMAQAMSLVMMVFMIVPVVAPGAGQLTMLIEGWRAIFVFMAAVALAISIWAWLRLPETLHPEYRRELSLDRVLEGFKIVASTRVSVCYTVATAFIFGALFGFINSAQQIYIEIYHLGLWFPVVFAGVASLMSLSAFLNSRFVGQIGMRRLSHGALLGFITVSLIWLAISLAIPVPFWLMLLLLSLAMFQFGWIGSNFNALAMEPLGHVAGTASSVLGFMQTAVGGVLGAAIGQSFDGTVMPLAAGFSIVSVLSLGSVLIAERGKLFRTQSPAV